MRWFDFRPTRKRKSRGLHKERLLVQCHHRQQFLQTEETFRDDSLLNYDSIWDHLLCYCFVRFTCCWWKWCSGKFFFHLYTLTGSIIDVAMKLFHMLMFFQDSKLIISQRVVTFQNWRCVILWKVFHILGFYKKCNRCCLYISSYIMLFQGTKFRLPRIFFIYYDFSRLEEEKNKLFGHYFLKIQSLQSNKDLFL